MFQALVNPEAEADPRAPAIAVIGIPVGVAIIRIAIAVIERPTPMATPSPPAIPATPPPAPAVPPPPTTDNTMPDGGLIDGSCILGYRDQRL